MISFQQSQPTTASQQSQQIQHDHQQLHQQQQQQQQQQQPQLQTMRLREDPAPITPAPRSSRKRKSPPSNNTPEQQQQQPPPPPQQQQPPPQQTMQHILPPPHTLMQMPGPLPPYPYAPTDYTPGGMPPQNPPQPPPGTSQPPQPSQSPPPGSGGRALSSSKRAEQNRKAQRAFRERRDQHVKALESRSQLLDAALASADEANRRWEECRALVDQLRVENAALRAALSQAQLLPPSAANPSPAVNNNGAHQEDIQKSEVSDQLNSNSAQPQQSEKKE